MVNLKFILQESKTIAIVGLSDNPDRPSFCVASYLLKHGYKIFPVNPNIEEWCGLKSYTSLNKIKEKIDIVDIFRKSKDVMPIVEEAIQAKAKTIWMQLSVIPAAELARKAGLNIVMNKCIMIEHARLLQTS
ncbi:MAG: CoA-binding protein [Candidatus Micrarchaeota archaeon]